MNHSNAHPRIPSPKTLTLYLILNPSPNPNLNSGPSPRSADWKKKRTKRKIEKPRLGLGFSVILVLVLSDPFLSDLFSESAFAFEKRERERDSRFLQARRVGFFFYRYFFIGGLSTLCDRPNLRFIVLRFVYTCPILTGHRTSSRHLHSIPAGLFFPLLAVPTPPLQISTLLWRHLFFRFFPFSGILLRGRLVNPSSFCFIVPNCFSNYFMNFKNNTF